MKISTEKPAIWPLLEKKFGISWDSGVIVTYNGTVHCKSGKLSPDLIVHEQTHIDQQAAFGDAEEWLIKYLDDPKFRLEQEVEAYQNQAAFVRKNLRNQSKKLKYFMFMWRDMAKYYCGMCTLEEAKKLVPLH